MWEEHKDMEVYIMIILAYSHINIVFFGGEEIRALRKLVNEKLQTVMCWLENQSCLFSILDVS